jgi:hypothetical protein
VALTPTSSTPMTRTARAIRAAARRCIDDAA